jgi:hypothetical protein
MTLATGFSFDKCVLLQFKSGLREQQRELQQLVPASGAVDSGARRFGTRRSRRPDILGVSVIAQSRANRDRLRLVKLPLERIQFGTFGICDECEKVIGLKRLQAIPWKSWH